MHRNWYHSSLSADGLDGNDNNGLKLGKNGQFFQVPSMFFGKIAKQKLILLGEIKRRSQGLSSSRPWDLHVPGT